MKKLMAVLMSTALFCSFALFTACSDKRGNGGGKLDGDFSTGATDEEVGEALTEISECGRGEYDRRRYGGGRLVFRFRIRRGYFFQHDRG